MTICILCHKAPATIGRRCRPCNLEYKASAKRNKNAAKRAENRVICLDCPRDITKTSGRGKQPVRCPECQAQAKREREQRRRDNMPKPENDRVCAHPGCPEITATRFEWYCPTHKIAAMLDRNEVAQARKVADEFQITIPERKRNMPEYKPAKKGQGVGFLSTKLKIADFTPDEGDPKVKKASEYPETWICGKCGQAITKIGPTQGAALDLVYSAMRFHKCN